MSDPRRSLPDTPRLDALLARLGRRLAALVWMHGLGTTLAGTALWLAFLYLTDRLLHVPAPIRVVHLVVLVALPCVLAWRELVRPLRRLPDARGRAVLLERAHPALRELLVSAVDLARAPSGAPELVAALRREAEARASELDTAGALAPQRPRRRLLAGLLCVAATLALLGHEPDATRVFLARLAGGATPWPQRTHLQLEIPGAGELVQVEQRGDELLVRAARGTDLPLVVRAEGVVPDEVVLHFSGGARAVLAGSANGQFRTLLRAVQEDQRVWATGGDDDDERPRLVLTVLDPPEVAALAVHVVPPAYSGLAERTWRAGDVEVLAGSRVSVHVLVDPPQARGRVRLLPRDDVLELVDRPFPAEAPEGEQAAEVAGLGFELEARESLRYRFELVDDSGLSNPDPGLFALEVLEDRPPRVELVSPGRGDVETTPGGALSVRAIARDDFGLQSLALEGGPAGGEPALRRALELLPVPAVAAAAGEPEPAGPGAGEARAQGFASVRLEVSELGGAEPPQAGQTLALVLEATDVRLPEPGRARSPEVRVRVVSPDELLRRLQDRLTRVRASAADLYDLQEQKQRSTLELLAALESDALERGDQAALAAALTGQRRVAGDARSLLREVAAVSELVLYARVDERAGPLLDALDARLAKSAARGFQPEPWRELVAARAGLPPAAGGLAAKLVDILAVALQVGEELAPSAADALAAAQDARELGETHAALERAAEAQRATVTRIEALLELLSEWDDYQSVLSLTRDILSRQKNLVERTKQYAKEN